MKEDALKTKVELAKQILDDQNHTRRISLLKAGAMITFSTLILTNYNMQYPHELILIGAPAIVSIVFGIIAFVPKQDVRPDIEKVQIHSTLKEVLNYCFNEYKETIDNNQINLNKTSDFIKLGIYALAVSCISLIAYTVIAIV